LYYHYPFQLYFFAFPNSVTKGIYRPLEAEYAVRKYEARHGSACLQSEHLKGGGRRTASRRPACSIRESCLTIK
jgi:hypothetical protein